MPSDPEGKMTQEELMERRENDLKTFRKKCLDFYTTAAQEMRKRLPLTNPLFQEAEFLDPANALSFEYRAKRKDLRTLCGQFKVNALSYIFFIIFFHQSIKL